MRHVCRISVLGDKKYEDWSDYSPRIQHWLVRIYVGRDPETRRRKYIGKFIHGGLRSAQAHLDRMLAERDLDATFALPGKPLASTSITGSTSVPSPVAGEELPRLLDPARTVCRPRLGAKTARGGFAGEIQGSTASCSNRRLSARTICYTHAVLFSALRQAVRWKLLLTNPAEDVHLPRQSRRRFTVFDVQQAKHFIAEISGRGY